VNITYERNVDHCSPTTYAKIVTIKEISPAENSDFLEKITFEELGWNCLSRKRLHKVGGKVFFIPPESVLPFELSELLEVTKYLSKGKVRVTKLRGNRSEGIIVEYDKVKPYLPHIMKWEDLPSIHMQGDSLPSSDISLHFEKFYTMPNILNEPDTFAVNEKIYYSEKIHGCLSHRAKIVMADGTTKNIHRIQEGEYVLGYKNRQVVPTKVTNIFDNGHGDTWLSIGGQRRRMLGKGNHYFAVHATPNHKFWIPLIGNYVQAKDIKIGDNILMMRYDLGLNPIQEQILLGKLLGDASLRTIDGCAGISWDQREKDSEYVNWTTHGLGNIAYNWEGSAISGYGTKMIRKHTVFLPEIKEIFSDFSANGKKCVPKWVANKLNPISLAFLYMDDGSLSHHKNQEDRASFALCSFTKEDCNIILEGLAKFGIKGEYYTSEEDYSRIRLNADDAEKFFLLVAPYIPPCMQYKLPERYRGHNGWLPTTDTVYKVTCREMAVDFIKENRMLQSRKYDIETETHNFFANYVLVHNSNVRCGKLKHPVTEKHQLYIGSHNNVLKESETNLYWQVVNEKLKKKLPENILFFGEIFGRGIQHLHYDCKQPNILLFAAMEKGRYMPIHDFLWWCIEYDLPHVEFHFAIYESLEQIRALADSPSELTDSHMREGVVITSVEYPEKMAKCLGFNYFTSKKRRTERH
jgi:hypothetical protein